MAPKPMSRSSFRPGKSLRGSRRLRLTARRRTSLLSTAGPLRPGPGAPSADDPVSSADFDGQEKRRCSARSHRRFTQEGSPDRRGKPGCPTDRRTGAQDRSDRQVLRHRFVRARRRDARADELRVAHRGKADLLPQQRQAHVDLITLAASASTRTGKGLAATQALCFVWRQGGLMAPTRRQRARQQQVCPPADHRGLKPHPHQRKMGLL